MANRVYFLSRQATPVTVEVTPVSIGVTSTVVQIKKSGGTVVDLGTSGSDATGKIATLSVGQFPGLLDSVLVITTVVNLTNVPKSQWDTVFDNFTATYLMQGGIDGDQNYNLDNDDKMQLMEGKLIVSTKAIKFATHAI